MLTSPVNVTIAASNGVALKANTAASDHSARREPPLLPQHQAQAAEAVIEPDLPSNSPLTNMNAVAVTVGNRTVLQELTLNVATMLRIARRADENLTSLFLRIIATIEAMPQAERLQFEIKAGLKPLKITLADLVMALRKPDGQEAARLTATAEAPTAVPGRTAANAATTTYLEEGTDSGHTEETLAMRAAARNSAAGQSVFSAESKMRPADARPTDAKVLQNQLKVMFEPGETKTAEQPETSIAAEAAAEDTPVVEDRDAAVAKDRASTGETNARPARPEAALASLRQPTPLAAGNAGENVSFSSASLKLDPLTVEKIRTVALAIANLAEVVRADQEHPAPEKAEDRRQQTMLTLKGLAEVVTAIPAKAAELLAAVVAEAAAPLPEPTDGTDRVATATFVPASDEDHLSDVTPASHEVVAEEAVASASAEEMPIELPAESTAVADHSKAEAETAMTDEHQAAPDFETMPPIRQDAAQPGVPFVHAQVQPAREEMVLAVEEEDAREETDDDGEDGGDEDGEGRRPRDEYDAIHDPVEEEDPAIVITRDSSEADRAFALYQRMGGF
jgi:hypothetical protein